MAETETIQNDIRLEQLLELLGHVATGDFKARYIESGKTDQVEALGVGFNMLVEEIAVKFAELERLNKIFVDRELAMHALKEKIADLEKALATLQKPTAIQ